MSSCRSERGSVSEASPGRLEFRPPRRPAPYAGEPGDFTLTLPAGESVVGYAPDVPGGRPLRLVLMFHGAGGVPTSALALMREAADAHGLLVVAVKSVRSTWDVIAGGYGPDVENIDEVLSTVSRRYPVGGYTVGGFSDGASYALSIGIANGDVFDSVIAFSPGFSAARTAEGRPRFFISHGVGDEVLPIERCSRRLVPLLRDAGYEVDYREFDGGHSVPPEIRRSAVQWLAEE